MKTPLSAALICALATFALAGASAPPAAILAPGTYRFEVHSQGKTTGRSTVTIARDGDGVTVTESLLLLNGNTTVKSTRRLDPATYSTKSWLEQTADSTDIVEVTAKNASYHYEGSTTTADAPVPGAPATVYDFFPGGFAAVPAMIRATGVKKYNEYCACGAFGARAVEIVALPNDIARPAGVLAGDLAISIRVGPDTANLWYDPKTNVLREVDFGKGKLSYVRTASP